MAKTKHQPKTKKRYPARKTHAFKETNEKGNNDTRPIEYTEAVVEQLLSDMLQALRDDRKKVHTSAGKAGLSVEIGYEFIYVGELLQKFGIYRARVEEWLRQWATNKKITDAYSEIKEIFGDRAWGEGLRGNLNSTIVKFHLINNYGAKDQSAVDLGGSLDHNLLMRDIIRRSKESKA